MDWYQIGTLIIALVAAGGGGKAWVEARKAKKAGTPADESEMREALPAVDWLTNHYRHEVETLRADMRQELTTTRQELKDEQEQHRLTMKQLHEANETIAMMERHIWLRKPPPPPARK